MAEGTQTWGIGVGLVGLGVILLLVVFVQGYSAFKNYNLEVNVPSNDTAAILGVSVQVLMNLLVKVAFLGVALAAGSVILGKGVDLVKGCPETREKPR